MGLLGSFEVEENTFIAKREYSPESIFDIEGWIFDTINDNPKLKDFNMENNNAGSIRITIEYIKE